MKFIFLKSKNNLESLRLIFLFDAYPQVRHIPMYIDNIPMFLVLESKLFGNSELRITSLKIG